MLAIGCYNNKSTQFILTNEYVLVVLNIWTCMFVDFFMVNLLHYAKALVRFSSFICPRPASKKNFNKDRSYAGINTPPLQQIRY